MRPIRGAAALLALVVLLIADTPVHAAWDNVFQVSCFRRRRVAVANFAPLPAAVPVAAAPPLTVAQFTPDPCNPCPPPPVCTTQYVQRSFYQPVTTMQQQTYLEPVTSYRTSYFYEPVTSYRYSCYFDPCTCSYQQVAQPVTSYRLRSQCNAVTSYLQRCQMVPVTSYRLSYYLEPVTTCCTPAANPCATSTPAVGTAPTIAPLPTTPPPTNPPAVGEQPITPAPSQKPRVGEQPTGTRFQETAPPPMPGAVDQSSRQPKLGAPQSPPPRVRMDRIVSLPSHTLQGEVVQGDRQQPQPRARLLFVSADSDGKQTTTVSDEQGRFQANLPQGKWLVYVRNREGLPVFQTQVQVQGEGTQPIRLVSR